MEQPLAPVTPLGSRTPHAHPGLYAIIGILSLVILAGVYWVFATYDVFPDRVPGPNATPANIVEYRNEEFGFAVALPYSWRGFTASSSSNEIYRMSINKVDPNPAARIFPEFSIHHPLSTPQVPRQDVPIMVFTIEQWSCIQREECSVSAAPIPPTELARNSVYVMALPARYNYAFPEGWEEVEAMLTTGPVSAFEPAGAAPISRKWRAHIDTEQGFSFWIPAYLDERSENDYVRGTETVETIRIIGYTSSRGDSGGASVYVSRQKLISIETMYEGIVPIEKLKTATVDGRTAYGYSDGDAGCGGTTYYIPLSNTSYAALGFGDCEGELLKMEPDIKTILASFRFSATPGPAPSAPPLGGIPISEWIPFSSKYFTLSFKVPPGFEVIDTPDSIRIAKAPFSTREIGDDNAFLTITRYSENQSKESSRFAYAYNTQSIYESSYTIDDVSFPSVSGTDSGRYEGDSAGSVEAIFFEKSWLEIVQRPANSDLDFNPFDIGHHIISTMKFSK